jgi:hypothetical protein
VHPLLPSTRWTAPSLRRCSLDSDDSITVTDPSLYQSKTRARSFVEGRDSGFGVTSGPEQRITNQQADTPREGKLLSVRDVLTNHRCNDSI